MRDLKEVVLQWFRDQGGGGGPYVRVGIGEADKWSTLDGDFDLVDLCCQLEEFLKKSVRESSYESVQDAADYDEDYGNVLWWHFPVCEPPYVGGLEVYQDQGKRVDGSIPAGWLTHFSRMPIVWEGDGLPKSAIPAASRKGK